MHVTNALRAGTSWYEKMRDVTSLKLFSRTLVNSDDITRAHLNKPWKIKLMQFIHVFWFGLLLYVPVNSYGRAGTAGLPNHTFFLGKLNQAVNKYFLHILSRDWYRQKIVPRYITIRDQRIAIHITIRITRFNLSVRMVPLCFQLK